MDTPLIVGLTSVWDYFGLEHLVRLGPSLERAGARASTIYPIWLAVSKALTEGDQTRGAPCRNTFWVAVPNLRFASF